MIKVDFEIKRSKFVLNINETFNGGITGIIGPSGSGKTSLLNAITGLIVPCKGIICIKDKLVFDADAKVNIPVHKRHIGYVFQSGRLFPHMTVEKNLRYGINEKRTQMIGFDEIIQILNLTHLLARKPSAISGGEYQRVALGRALLSSPDILLLDEPFSAVDSKLKSQIIQYLQDIHQKTNIPMLVVSHELSDLLKLTNTVCIIKDGECIGHGEYQNLINSRFTPIMLGLKSVLNSLVMKVEEKETNNDILVLRADTNKKSIRVLCENCKTRYNPGDELKIFISSQNIALSSRRIAGVSIQNQLEGTVVNIYDQEKTSYCFVDIGLQLVVAISAESRRCLGIQIGSTVWCLFKSVDVRVAP